MLTVRLGLNFWIITVDLEIGYCATEISHITLSAHLLLSSTPLILNLDLS